MCRQTQRPLILTLCFGLALCATLAVAKQPRMVSPPGGGVLGPPVGAIASGPWGPRRNVTIPATVPCALVPYNGLITFAMYLFCQITTTRYCVVYFDLIVTREIFATRGCGDNA